MSNDVQTPRVPWTWPLLISALVRGEDLPSEATAWAMAEVMGTDASTLAAQINSNTELVYGRWDSEPVGPPPTTPIGIIA